MAKECLIYETLNNVKDLKVSKNNEGLMTLSGVFGVCGVKNNNNRVYETSNYKMMLSDMKKRINEEGSIPGELEHPQSMNTSLENISHKIVNVDIDEHGVATGTIVLLDTPKGKIAQAIVKGGLPLYVSSRATGNIDNAGKVTLEKIYTYDLVGTPGFSQAKMHLNEGQICESLSDNAYLITTQKDGQNMDIEKRLELLESRIEMLSEENDNLREYINNGYADSVQNWIVNEFAPEIQKWITHEYTPTMENKSSCKDYIMNEFAPAIQQWLTEEYSTKLEDWMVNEFAVEIQKWLVEEYSRCIQNWIVNEYSGGIQDWLIEEYSEGLQNWIVNEFAPEVQKWLVENFVAKEDGKNSIDETLKLLEGLEVKKPKMGGPGIINENHVNEPLYIAQMDNETRVKWEMASPEVKESIKRRAKLYNFFNEGAVDRFWKSINFDEVIPVQNQYVGRFNDIEDMKERAIREALANFRLKHNL